LMDCKACPSDFLRALLLSGIHLLMCRSDNCTTHTTFAGALRWSAFTMFCLLSFQLFSFVGGEAFARINSIQMRIPPPRTALNSLTLKPISLPQTLILSPLLAVAKDLPSKLSDSSPTQTVAAVVPSFQTTHVKRSFESFLECPRTSGAF
jgi:hypothetical protein